MKINWITQKTANRFVIDHHRHHGKVVGAIFCLGLFDGDDLRAVAVCGRPVSRHYNSQEVLEVTRLCSDGVENGCSMLYAACARIAREMGFKTVQTYTLESESGASLKAAGWALIETNVGGKTWNGREHSMTNLFETTEKRPQEMKNRWGRYL